eukprot:2175470-Pleurochrysis_carterae.AAC.1
MPSRTHACGMRGRLSARVSLARARQVRLSARACLRDGGGGVVLCRLNLRCEIALRCLQRLHCFARLRSRARSARVRRDHPRWRKFGDAQAPSARSRPALSCPCCSLPRPPPLLSLSHSLTRSLLFLPSLLRRLSLLRAHTAPHSISKHMGHFGVATVIIQAEARLSPATLG